MTLLGMAIDNPLSKYFLVLSIVVICAFFVRNLARSEIGRAWMAVRDMDIAAEAIGINLMKTKLLAFGVSSFLCGVAGALWAYVVLGTVEPQAFDIARSFEILFMIVIGGFRIGFRRIFRSRLYDITADIAKQRRVLDNRRYYFYRNYSSYRVYGIWSVYYIFS